MRRIYWCSVQMSNIQEIYRTTNDADLQGILNVGPRKEQSISKDVVSTLIGKLGLSLEEALMRLMG